MKLFLEPGSVALIGVSRLTGPGAYNNFEMMLTRRRFFQRAR